MIPESCREPVLAELHMSHPGIVKMKSLARIHVWWPGIDKTIEQLVHDCEACQSVRNSPAIYSLFISMVLARCTLEKAPY